MFTYCVSLSEWIGCRYALTGAEVKSILMQRLVKVDGKVRTDSTYPAGYMDVVDIDKTDEHFRLVYDAKGRFVTHRITKVSMLARPLEAHHETHIAVHSCSPSNLGLSFSIDSLPNGLIL